MVGDGSCPKRADCSYYIRTGLCRFGSTCRFNHPHDRKLVIATTRIKGEYPERIGEPECEFYLKTGTCKFKVTCKFHHPRNKAGTGGRVSHNVLGYPLRPDEDDCSYFLRTGHCKFGGTCKSNHPQSQSTNLMVSLRGSPVYSALQSPTGQESYSCSRASSVSQGGLFSSLFHSGNSVPLGYYALPRENVFPERPGQPECEFYMKTGDCKFGAVCKFHHPRGRQTPASDGVLSPVGLPLRPFGSVLSIRNRIKTVYFFLGRTIVRVLFAVWDLQVWSKL
ncbi:unnamed protein product [Arabis nemorensis]|uniref:C3H1-type domain-containing protein n=1 Tax=Arabis nemorensis TaxID=586526 RepID=A0A565CMI0_9BRAS|nr:unnamed protein product [Arabis nemorensis]